MTEQSLWYLENIDVSGIFCPQKMSDESHFGHAHKKIKKGQNIYVPEDAADKIYLINEGRIKIGNYGVGGKEITKAILGKGEIFGELAIVGDSKRRDFALAMEETSICIMPRDEMKSLMKDHSGLNLFMMKIMGKRTLEMEKRLESLVFKDSRSRIVEFLLDLVDKKGQRVGYEMLVRKFITHQEVANMTATSRQTVTTVLNAVSYTHLTLPTILLV